MYPLEGQTVYVCISAVKMTFSPIELQPAPKGSLNEITCQVPFIRTATKSAVFPVYTVMSRDGVTLGICLHKHKDCTERFIRSKRGINR